MTFIYMPLKAIEYQIKRSAEERGGCDRDKALRAVGPQQVGL
jgi:hypothetical protein